MADKKLLPSIFSKIQQSFQKATQTPVNKFNASVSDNEGWYRQGRFTPIKQIGSMAGNIKIGNNPTVGQAFKQVLSRGTQAFNPYQGIAENKNNNAFLRGGADIVNQGLKSFTNMSTLGLVQPNLGERQTKAGLIGNVGGGFAGFVVNPLGKAMGSTDKLVAKIAPKATGLAPKLIKGLGSEALQTLGYSAASLAGNKLGLNQREGQFTKENLGQDFLMGSLMRGVLSPETGKGVAKAFGKLYEPDVKNVEEIMQGLAKDKKSGALNIEFRTAAEQDAETYRKSFNLMSQKEWKKLSLEDKFKMIKDKMLDLKASGEQIQMGITDQSKEVKPALIDKTRDLGLTPQKGTDLQTGKIKTTLSETKLSEPSTKVSQISGPQLSISKKGKLNTDKLNITPEQKASIDTLQDNVPVTVIGNKDVIEQSKLTTGRKKVLTDNEMKVRLAQQLNSRQEVVSLSKQFEKMKQSGASELELIVQKQKIIDQSRIAQQQGTFAGRLLQAQNILANEIATPEQKIYAMLDVAGVDSKKYLKDAINVDFKNATETVNFYRKYVPAKFGEVLDEIRYTNMLSSPLTQIVNTFSNVLQSGIVKPIEKTITGGLDFISSKFTGKERKYFASQGIDYAKGYYSALPEAWKKFKDVASGKEISIRPDMFDISKQRGIPTTTKGALKWYTLPLKVLEASDQFFKTLVESGERKSLARLNLPEAEIAKRAAQSADYTLFRQKFDPTGELGQGTVLKAWDKWNSAVQNLRKVPGGNWILPFIQTPTNILKQGFEYSPLGISTVIGAKQPLEQLSKAMIGTAAFLSLYGIADKGGTTWDVPSNSKDKELFYSAGMQPYSIKIGDKWVSYSKLGPLSYPLAMASALKWVEQNNPDQSVVENLQDSLGEMIGFFGDQSYVRSIGDVIDAVKGGSDNMLQNAISGEITNLSGQLVPYRSFLGWLTRIIDPVYRKPDGVVENLKAQTPGLSTSVPAYTDIYGEESKRDLPGLNAISPLKVSVEKPESKALFESQQQYRVGQQQEKNRMAEFERTGTTSVSKDKPIYYTADDGSVKKIDIGKLTSMPEQTAYQKAIKEKQKYTLVDDILENLPEDQQIQALDALGITPEDATYYNVARQENALKYIYVEDEVRGMIESGQSKDQILSKLASMRKAVNGKILLADGVINDLVDNNIISYQDGKNLKNIDKDLTQKKLKAKSPKKVSVTSKKFTPMKSTYTPIKLNISSTSSKSKFQEPKWVKANFTTPKNLL